MSKKLRQFIPTLLVVLLLANLATAANVIFYTGPTGQTLYVRITNPAGSYVAIALTEGSSGGEGNYTASEATIAGLTGMSSASTGNGCAFRVYVGGTPSTTVTDPIVAFGYLPWSGSAEVAQAQTGDAYAATSTVLTRLNNAFQQFFSTNTSNTTVDSLNTAAGSGGVTVSPFLIAKGHSWKFDSPTQTTAPNQITEIAGFSSLLVEMDFTGVIDNSDSISSIGSVTFADVGGSTEPIVSSSAARADKKAVIITLDGSSATAATNTISVAIVTVDGQHLTRKATLVVR